MVFGTAYLGKIKKIGTTCIETKFIVLGLPLFPTGSIIVLEKRGHTRLGIDIPLNGASVFAAYARMISFWAGAIGFLFGAGNADRGHGNGNLIIQLTGTGLLLLWAYLYFYFGKASNTEIEQWNVIEDTPGVNALPGWLDRSERVRALRSVEFVYSLQYKTDWKLDVIKKDILPEQLRLLYKIVLYHFEIDPTENNKALVDKLGFVLKQRTFAANENAVDIKTVSVTTI